MQGLSHSMHGYFFRLGPGLRSIPDLRSRALMTSDRTLVWASIGCVAKNTVDLLETRGNFRSSFCSISGMLARRKRIEEHRQHKDVIKNAD